MMQQAIINIKLEEDIFCGAICECIQIDENFTTLRVGTFLPVTERHYENFGKMMMKIHKNKEYIVKTLFNEIEGNETLKFNKDGLEIIYDRDTQPQDWI